MTSVTKVVKSVGPKLMPFFKTLAVYFVIFIPHDQPSLLAMVLKCLPIISLIIFVLLHGMSLGNEYQYSRKIIAGLLFCCIGDAFLIWPQYFCLGIVAFGVGHISYILAFGLKPFNLPLGVFLYFINALGVMYIMPDLHGIFIPGIIIYSYILTTMVWRAIARVQFFEVCIHLSTTVIYLKNM
ncbi:lysoplasmalogenase-like protein TMEM86A [Agrilus planipennis]|uniref:lysoplasmalogenase n=1 Tax=Agrilus planipennis TaxID=224129 RepID=A0A7F5RFH9_AGRPL|nr:lysoplasmalogenase-like protein TMEM86A [Agrilus planipennis]